MHKITQARKELNFVEHIVNTLTLLVDKQQRQHECTKQSFEQVREQVEEINELQADVLYLDVGGIKFHTSRRVLMSPSASTDVLPVLFGADTVTLELDDGYTFFDRDSTWFSNVLSYLRQELERPTGGRCPAEPPGKPALNYYGLDTLFRRAQQRSIIMVAGSDDLFFDSVPFHHQVYNSVEQWDGVSWGPLPRMLDRRFGSAAAILNGRLVVTGGFDGTRYLSSAEAFDPNTRQWHALPPMRTERGEHAAAVVGGWLLVTGGVNHRGLCRDVEAYDPDQHTWVPLPSLAVGRSQCAACVLDHKMLVIGGENNSNLPLGLAEQYDPVKREWRRMPSMLSKRSCCTVGVVDGLVVVSGGFDDDGNELATLEVSDPKTWRWRPLQGPDPMDKATPAYSIEARVLLHGDEGSSEDVALIETLRVSEGGGGSGPHTTRSYATYEIQTVPKQRTVEKPRSPEPKKAAPPAAPAKRHPPVSEERGMMPRNRIMITH